MDPAQRPFDRGQSVIVIGVVQPIARRVEERLQEEAGIDRAVTVAARGIIMPVEDATMAVAPVTPIVAMIVAPMARIPVMVPSPIIGARTTVVAAIAVPWAARIR